jgi:hypothetical protein
MTMMTELADRARSAGDPKVTMTGPSSLGSADRLARNLGWLSWGLGAAELFGSERIAHTLGMEGSERLIRAYGAREIAAGVTSLSVNANVGIASRVVGDVLDLATLALAKGGTPGQQRARRNALAVVAAITVVDVLVFAALQKRHGRTPADESFDYGDRTGFPGGIEAARGVAARRGPPESFRSNPANGAVMEARAD